MKRVFINGMVMFCLAFIFLPIAWAEKPITVIVSEPLSGPFKAFGDWLLRGAELAVDEINADGGLLGRKVEVVPEDNQLKLDIGRRTVERHLMEGTCDILVSGMSSSIGQAFVDLTKQYGAIYITTCISDVFSGEAFSYNLINGIYRSSMLARFMVTYLAENKPFKKFYLLNPDYSYGRDSAARFEKELRRLIPDVQIVGNDFHPLVTKDFSPLLSKIKSTGAECILSSSFGVDLSVLVKQRRELGVKAVVAANPLSPTFTLEEIAEAAIGDITGDYWLNTVNTEESREFLAKWRKKYKGTKIGEPNCMVVRNYVPLKLLLEGMKKAKSVEVNKVMPVVEGMRVKTVNGEAYLRPCDHQLQMPIPVAEIVSKSYPYFGVPVMIPAEKIEVEQKTVDNPRCKK